MGAGMGFEPTVTEVVAYEATELTAAQTRLNLCGTLRRFHLPLYGRASILNA